MEDWLNDPLMVYDKEKGQRIYLKAKSEGANADTWQSFHFATRLKLEGSVYFCSQILGPARLSDELGLPLLNHRLGLWHSHAFFHELCSAYDTLLQEINAIYNCSITVEKVTWQKIQPKLPTELFGLLDRGRNQSWFREVIGFRNTATHHYGVPMEKTVGGTGDQSWGQSVDDLNLVYIDHSANPPTPVRINIAACEVYLKRMLAFINDVWRQMTQQFE